MSYSNKFRACVLLCILLLPATGYAQNNPYKISDNLYELMLRANKQLGEHDGMLTVDSMFTMAGKQKDLKAQCIALNLACMHYYKMDPYDEEKHIAAVRRIRDFAMNTPYQQYLFGGWNTLINHYNRDNTQKALEEVKEYQALALKLNNAYGLTFSYKMMGDLYYNLSQYPQALEQYKLAVDYCQATGQTKNIHTLYLSMARSYWSLHTLHDMTSQTCEETYKYVDLSIKHSPTEAQQLNGHIYVLRIAPFAERPPGENLDYHFEAMQRIVSRYGLGTISKSAYHHACLKYYNAKGDFARADSYADSIRNKAQGSTYMLNLSSYYLYRQDYRQAYYDRVKYDSTLREEYTRNLTDAIAMNAEKYKNSLLQLEKNHLALQNAGMKMQNQQMLLSQGENERNLLLMDHQRDSLQLTTRTLEMERLRIQQKNDSIRASEAVMKEQMEKDKSRRKIFYILFLAVAAALATLAYLIINARNTRRLKREKEATERMLAHTETLQKETEEAKEAVDIALEELVMAKGETERALQQSEEEKIKTEQALEEARKADKLKDMFLNNMSHEIRTPLNAIVGFTDVLNSEEAAYLEAEEKKELMDLIHTNTNLLTTLINDLLDLSRMQSGCYQIVMTDFNLATLCQVAVESVRNRVPQGVTMSFIPSAEHPDYMIHSDEKRVLQALTNFLTNACKYTEKGSITVNYEIQPHEEDSSRWMDIAVTDTGSGIPADKAAIIFQRFEKLDSFKQGTGLGLNICSTIATLLHGRVWLDPRYQDGCRFVLSLPI